MIFNKWYTLFGFYDLTKKFKKQLKNGKKDIFFKNTHRGRHKKDNTEKLVDLIITSRKHYLSVPEIQTVMDAKGNHVSQRYIYLTIKKEGFGRLPRRSKENREIGKKDIIKKIEAPKSISLNFEPEVFSTECGAGILALAPILEKYGIAKAIRESDYPETGVINKESSILSVLALKFSNIRRYSADDLWCMDRGIGLIAGLNVLPKAAWFSSYSSRITREVNISFLRKLHRIWVKEGLLSDTMNLDFTTIPYWGDSSHLENNWSGKRHQPMASMLAVLAQDPDSGIIDYSDTNVRHKNEPEVVLEFIDFYKVGHNKGLKYLVFDSKFTTYQNLSKLDDQNIKFVTIRRRGKNIVNELADLPKSNWKKIHVIKADGKGRTLKVHDQKLDSLKGYLKPIRQIAITGHGRLKPSLIITNDFDSSSELLIRKYSKRWLVEKEMSEQIEFFHLNRLSSSIVIKVDFDLTMSIVAHNIYRLFAKQFQSYQNISDQSVFEKFLFVSGSIEISDNDFIFVKIKKKRHLPLLLDVLKSSGDIPISWLANKSIVFQGASTS